MIAANCFKLLELYSRYCRCLMSNGASVSFCLIRSTFYDYMIYPKQFRSAKIPVEKNRCFFLMPFHQSFDLIYGTVKDILMENGLKNFVNQSASIAQVQLRRQIFSRCAGRFYRSLAYAIQVINNWPAEEYLYKKSCADIIA